MSLSAPYSNNMRIGQGFNTYTQETRLENAVKIAKRTTADADAQPDKVKVTPATPPSPPLTPEPAKPQPAIPPTTITPAPGTARAADAADAHTSETLSTTRASTILDPNPAVVSVVPLGALEDTPLRNQSVTYSTRAIDNVSDIMDALNISTAMSIKYGTIHGNASASYVNENKVLDSQLNYVVSVKVNNDSETDALDMEFQPIDDLPPERFTEVYGDSFISGFLEGGEFNAIISVQVNDKSKLSAVKQAVDLQLAVGPMPVTVGAKESVDKSHSEILTDTEITISVNWTGGGDIKRPEIPWTMSTVVAVANAFPSLVARYSSKTSAILTRYQSLRSFQAWKWKMTAQSQDWATRFRILNYAPCALYTADLFDALMGYKKLWKKIGDILADPTKFEMRKAQVVKPTMKMIEAATSTESPIAAANSTKVLIESPCDKITTNGAPRQKTFDITDDMISADWHLDTMNAARDPIPLDPIALNEARLLCREAMTLITEEAARLVDHPHLAYAEFDPITRKTQMKRPNYAYPEILRERLPIRIRNDAADDCLVPDAAAVMTKMFARHNDLYCHLVGDIANPHRKFKAFTSLSYSESTASATPSTSLSTIPESPSSSSSTTPTNPLTRISLHGSNPVLGVSTFARESEGAIAAIGFSFANDPPRVKKGDDGCTVHEGKPFWRKMEDGRPGWRVLDLAPSAGAKSLGSRPASMTATNITSMEISYVPGSGRIAGLAFLDSFALGTGTGQKRLEWTQWGASGHEPAGLKKIVQGPPDDGGVWRFVGVCGEFDDSVWGSVLARVSGVWRRG